MRAKIEAEIKSYVLQASRVQGYHLKRLKTELCPRFEGPTTAEIYRLWSEREKQIMKEFAADLSKPLKTFDIAEQSNVLPFEQGNKAAV